MKINPEISQAPPSPALPTVAVPTPSGEASVFAAMLGQPRGGAAPEPGVVPTPPEDPRSGESPKMSGTAATAATVAPPSAPAEGELSTTASLAAQVVEATVQTPHGLAEAADVLPPISTDTALVVPQPSTPKPAPRPTVGPNGRPLAHRAFGFRELGVWGHRGLNGETANPRVCGVTPGYPETKPVGEMDGPRGWDPDLALPGERDGAHRRDATGAPDKPVANMADIADRHSAQLSLNPDRPPPDPRDKHGGRVGPGRASKLQSQDDNNVETTIAEAAEPSATPQPSTPLSLSVFDGAGGLQIVAAMPDINPDAVARLRRIAESLAREFGLSLAEFSLNGAAIDAPAATDRNPQWR